MTSLYNTMFDDIPLYVVPGTEDSDVIEYETNEQMNVRLMNKMRAEQQMAEIERLRIQALLGHHYKSAHEATKCKGAAETDYSTNAIGVNNENHRASIE